MLLNTAAYKSQHEPWIRCCIVYEFSGFPKCIATIVADYCAVLQLLSWIDLACIDWRSLCKNPEAVKSGMINIKYADRYALAPNPAAADYIKQHWDWFCTCWGVWENPNLFEWMIENHPDTEGKWECIQHNTNPNAIKHILECSDRDIDEISLTNPSISQCGSWVYILENITSQGLSLLYGNPKAMEDGMCDDLDEHTDDFGYLSMNPHPRAIEYLKMYPNKIDWEMFSSNPGIFEYRADPELVNALSE